MGKDENSDITAHGNEKFIDIERIIASKNPKLAKLLPRFVINYLKRIVHEDSINFHLEKHASVFGLDFIHASLNHFGVKLIVHGIENIRTNERLVIVSNHPLGGLDGMGLMAAVGNVNREMVFPVNDLLLNLPNLREWFIPINKHGGHPKEAVKLLDEMMQSDKNVLYFPAGLVSRKRKGKICDLEWKKTFVTKARKFNRKIVPVYIDGENSKFFYNLANLRKFFRIKTNIEMLYLVNEMYKQYDKVINIYFGRSLEWSNLPSDMNDEELAAYIKGITYKLPLDESFAGKGTPICLFNLTCSDNASFA